MRCGTDWIGGALVAWVRWVLRYPKLILLLGLTFGGLCLQYAARNLGINADTADMISPELAWRQDFIDYRDSFAARNRNIVIVVDAAIPERADEIAAAIAAELRSQPGLYRAVFLAGDGEFFERNGLLYLSLAELDSLGSRLADAQPLIGRMRQRFDGIRLMEIIGEVAQRDGAEGRLEPLYREVSAALDAAGRGSPYTVSWQRLLRDERPQTGRRYVLLQPMLEFDRMQPAAAAMSGIRALVGELELGAGAERVRVTGTVAMEHEELGSVSRGAGLAGLAALAMVAAVLYLTLRSIVLLLLSVVTLLVGLSGTAAFAAAAVGHLNLLSVAFAVLYIGLGVDFVLHICLRLKELMADGREVADALLATMRGVGSSLVICAVTTAAGFYSFIPTPFSGVSELGLISGTGMFVSLLVSVTFLPAGLVQLYSAAEPRSEGGWSGARWLRPLIDCPRAVVATAVVAAVGAAATLPWVRFDTNPVRLRDPSTESVTTLEELAADGEAVTLNMVAIAPGPEVAGRWITALEALPTVSAARSLDSLVPAEQPEKLAVLEDIDLLMGPGFAALNRVPPEPGEFERALVSLAETLAAKPPPSVAEADLARALQAFLAQGAEAPDQQWAQTLRTLEGGLLETLPVQLERLATGLAAQAFDRDALPEALTARWLTDDGRELIEIAPAENINEDGAAERFVGAVRTTIPGATGLPVVHQEAGRTVVGAFQMAFVYALIMVSVILWVFLRDLRDSVFVIIPVVLVAGLTAALTVPIGLPFNFANIIALPLLLGVGVDNGIHMVHRMRSEPPSGGRMIETSTSRAVFASGLTTIASFGNLAFAAHLGMASMGRLLTLGMVVTLVATLVLLPAMLSLRPAS